MKFYDTINLGFKPLVERKTRAALTILMVVVGIASIIALTSQTAGIQSSITSALQTLGPTTILVSPRAGGTAGTEQLTQADVVQISSVPGVEAVIPVVTAAVSMLSNGQPVTVTVIGVSSSGLTSLLGRVDLLAGSVYPDSDVPLAVVGHDIAFPSSGPPQFTAIGQPIVVTQQLPTGTKTFTLTVQGILASSGSTPIIPVDTSIFVPIQAALSLFNRHAYSMLLVQATSVDEVNRVADFLTQLYGNNASVTTLQQIAQTVSSILGQIGILLGLIAGISLTVAGIGIMNIMLISVYERTREIGILKAVGFGDVNVLEIFLSEALIIGIIGAVVGLVAGTGASYLLAVFFVGSFRGQRQAAGRSNAGSGGFGAGLQGQGGSFSLSYSPVITPDIVVISLAVAILVSAAAGIYPAWRAARMEPIKALKYE